MSLRDFDGDRESWIQTQDKLGATLNRVSTSLVMIPTIILHEYMSHVNREGEKIK